MSKGLRIINLRTENFKRVRAVDITPNGDVVVLQGQNEQGKTSVLDSISAALQLRAVKKGIPEPVRRGAKKGQVIIDLGDYVVHRTFNEGGTTSLRVTTPTGDTVAKPQSILDGLIGDLSFDPLEFSRKSPKDQRELIASLLKQTCSLDISTFEGQYQNAYEERTDLNRELKRLKGQLENLRAPTEEDPTEEVDLSDLTKRLSDRMAAIAQWEDIETQISRAKQIELELQERLHEAQAFRTSLESLKRKIGEPGPADELHEEIENLEEINRRAREVKQYHAVVDAITETTSKIDKCNARMDLADIEKDEAIEAADLPVPGLGITEDGITLDGVPFIQCSAAQRLKASMAIAMKANPTVRVILIRDGSLLDDANMRVIEEMADDQDFQLWVECVGEDDGTGVYIEDGSVVN